MTNRSLPYAGPPVAGSPLDEHYTVGDFVVDPSGIVWECTVSGKPGTFISRPSLQTTGGTMTGLFFPVQAPTATAPAYVKGGLYFDTTLNALRVGGATAWETVTSA